MKIRLFTFIVILFVSIYYSCGSHKKKSEEKYNLEENLEQKEKDTDIKEKDKIEKKDAEQTENAEGKKNEKDRKKRRRKRKHKLTIAEVFAENIKAENLEYHVEKLSDSLMLGRETGTEGEQKAAKYISDFFKKNKLLYPDQQNSYYQKYTATQNKKPKVILETDAASYEFGKDFFGFFPHDSVEMEFESIIYVGHGINEKKYNDYAYKDVKKEVILVVGGEPRDKYGNYIISHEIDPYTGRSLPSVWSRDPIKSYILRRNAAKENGAKLMLYYDPDNLDYFWDNYRKHFENSKEEVSLSQDSIYDFFINKNIFTNITGYDKPEEMEYTKKTRKLSVPIKLTYESRGKVINGINVLGIIEGDTLSNDYVVILSHYDGQGQQNGKIYPSANDNASGVAASLEIAKTLSMAKDSGYIAKKNILFLNLSGTENNKIGIKYYIKHPVIPLEQTVAIIELHKLGRVETNTKGDAQEFFPINIGFEGFDERDFKKDIAKLEEYNEHISLKYKPLVEKSDYTFFKKEKIPVIYFTGGHFSDEHKITDTPDRISYEVLEKRTNFIFQIIWKMFYREKR